MEQSNVNLPENATTQGMKRQLIKFVGGEREPEEVMVGVGTTAGDVLSAIQLSPMDFCLSHGSADSVFANDENLYPLISDGGLLYAGSRADAGV